MATTSPSLPEQQQPQEVVPNPETVPSSSRQSSGSIGPFFAVISVLAVLTVISCFLGRICARRTVTPLESISHGDCFGWVKRKCSRGVACVGSKAMAAEKGSNDG
ncbi:uncharacterized protein LOC132280990 [Cornus florida]|uniref:uncharacterized protein LOC132280990 n=1 Tax=Cornus florida TaxID=4283 RepID=UPI00289C2954|nr:uncharacterized protein LOC132280990 [Cornus florida]